MKLPAGWIFRLKPNLKNIEVYESELILCKDCKNYVNDEDGRYYCKIIVAAERPKPDDYCSRASRGDE